MILSHALRGRGYSPSGLGRIECLASEGWPWGSLAATVPMWPSGLFHSPPPSLWVQASPSGVPEVQEVGVATAPIPTLPQSRPLWTDPPQQPGVWKDSGNSEGHAGQTPTQGPSLLPAPRAAPPTCALPGASVSNRDRHDTTELQVSHISFSAPTTPEVASGCPPAGEVPGMVRGRRKPGGLTPESPQL